MLAGRNTELGYSPGLYVFSAGRKQLIIFSDGLFVQGIIVYLSLIHIQMCIRDSNSIVSFFLFSILYPLSASAYINSIFETYFVSNFTPVIFHASSFCPVYLTIPSSIVQVPGRYIFLTAVNSVRTAVTCFHYTSFFLK